MSNNQKGFAVIESLLVVIILAMIAGVGCYIWHTNQQAKATFDAASKSAQSSPGTKKSKININSQSGPQTLAYAKLPVDAQQAIFASATAEGDCFKGQTYHTFTGTGGANYDTSGYIFVHIADRDGKCDDSDHLFVKQNDKWTDVGRTQEGWDCSLLTKYKVPSNLLKERFPAESPVCIGGSHPDENGFSPYKT